MGATSGAGTAYPPGAPEVTPSVSGVHVIRSLVLCVFCGSLFVLFLLAIVLSVLLWYADSDYPFGIFKLIWWLLTEIIISPLRTKGDILF